MTTVPASMIGGLAAALPSATGLCTAELSAAQSIPNNAATTIGFANSDAGGWSDANEQFTAPAAGRYAVSVQLILQGATSDFTPQLRILKNGAAVRRTADRVEASSTSGRHTRRIEAVLDLAKDDLIAADVFQNSGGALDIAPDGAADRNHIQIARIG